MAATEQSHNSLHGVNLPLPAFTPFLFSQLLQSCPQIEFLLETEACKQSTSFSDLKSVQEWGGCTASFFNLFSNAPVTEPKKKQCKALFDYQPVNEDELELKAGDIIDINEEVLHTCLLPYTCL